MNGRLLGFVVAASALFIPGAVETPAMHLFNPAVVPMNICPMRNNGIPGPGSRLNRFASITGGLAGTPARPVDASTPPGEIPPGNKFPGLQSLSIAGVPADLVFRALQPGEAILVKAKADPAIKSVVLKFRKQTRRIEILSETEAAALFGIDVETTPGPYPLEAFVARLDGSVQTITREIVVEPKEFPKSEISIDPKLLVPPPGEAERVKREAELVAAVLGVVSTEWLATGNFVSPLPDHAPFPNFGQRRVYNKTSRSTHAGVDIAAPGGTPARASNTGRVVLAGSLYLSGNTVIIDHGLGVFSYYCHFSKLLVKRGDLVRKGDLIAQVGSTGLSTGPHLHWSLRLLDSRIDPFSLVALPLK